MIARLLLLVLGAWPALCWGQTPEAPARLAPIVVTPTRLEQQPGEAIGTPRLVRGGVRLTY